MSLRLTPTNLFCSEVKTQNGRRKVNRMIIAKWGQTDSKRIANIWERRFFEGLSNFYVLFTHNFLEMINLTDGDKFVLYLHLFIMERHINHKFDEINI